MPKNVVNWFQIVFLCEDSQGHTVNDAEAFCCELISNCIFMWGFTGRREYAQSLILLWIDFKLYFYVRIHRASVLMLGIKNVVNWFQIVFLCEDSQVLEKKELQYSSCELISNCIFMWGFTGDRNKRSALVQLWIDFKLYFYVRIHR